MPDIIRRDMTDLQHKQAAKHFIEFWRGKGYERGESQKFWLSLLGDVLVVEHASEIINFEDQVHLDHTAFIDGFIPYTHVLIEQKSVDKSLSQPIRQSDGTMLKPIEQAMRYVDALLHEQGRAAVPHYIVICNFASFHIYDMDYPRNPPIEIHLENLENDYYLLEFLVKTGQEHLQREMEISYQAGKIIGDIYKALLKQYNNPKNEETLRSLNTLCVRLVFCFYAEDSGIFGHRLAFYNYLHKKGEANARQAIINLFKTLDTKIEDRDPYMDEDLAAFPYVNGGLFSANETIEIPRINAEIYDLILNQASAGFDWSEISPTIFGALFESTLNPETRRKGGMHYTSVEDIHKVIDPLFLDAIKYELKEALSSSTAGGWRTKKLKALQDKISTLTFFDPACGSGNFLTESYLSLRHIENTIIRALKQLSEGQIMMDLIGNENIGVKVSISQFYGLEINDFAVSVAKTALWIAEAQMLIETKNSADITTSEFLPLKTNANIHKGNALLTDWNDIITNSNLNYIMGNPPFVGKKYQSAEQKSDLITVFGAKTKGVGNLDYVTGWFRKAIEYMQHTNITAAFVSTNSISQGEHVPLFWKELYEQFSINIIFAHQTFVWDNDASDKAAVHCVIIGFNAGTLVGHKTIYSNGIAHEVQNIHPYLIDLPNVFIENRAKPLFDSQPLVYGSFALDDGNYTISEEEYHLLINSDPEIHKYLRPFIGSEEFINGKNRYCIWLKDADIHEIRRNHIIDERVKKVQEWRLSSKRKETIAAASTPTLFAEIRQPDTDYLAIPITSSENREYIPIGYMSKDTIASNHLLILPDASLYEFGILTSNVHMSWMRTVAGRLKSDYNYSARIVYNNFPWCNPTPEQKAEIERTAKGILDARSIYSNYTLADLYDRRYMPNELITAHRRNNAAVLKAYGIQSGNSAFSNEAACVAFLMDLYKRKVEQNQ